MTNNELKAERAAFREWYANQAMFSPPLMTAFIAGAEWEASVTSPAGWREARGVDGRTMFMIVEKWAAENGFTKMTDPQNSQLVNQILRYLDRCHSQ